SLPLNNQSVINPMHVEDPSIGIYGGRMLGKR
ncbi:MAG: hypothetical protein ACI9K9_002267, partial [Neolewinella sp.]